MPYTITDPDDDTRTIQAKRWTFTLQMAWQPTPLGKRLENKQLREQGQQNPALAAQGGGQ
jgi:hypothetical protein